MAGTGREKLRRVMKAFSSPRAFHDALVLKSSSSFLVNEDLLPSPPERQTWTMWDYCAYWWSESWAISTWALGSSMIALGATIRDAILVVLFANILSAVVIVFNGVAAARYHIGFPVLSRMSFGIYGQYFVVILRALLGIIWGGVQLYFEGQFISICLSCIFPGWMRMRNTIPESQHITTQVMVGFFLAFVFTLPFMFVHTSHIQLLFRVKSIVLPLTGIGIVCWATSENGGMHSSQIEDTSAKTSTAVFAWGLVSQFNAVMGANSALLVTVPDLARYSKTPRAQIVGQAVGLPLAQTICASFGIITTAAVKNMYGTAYWNPYELFSAILARNYTGAGRAGVFFAAAAFAFAALGTSVACNIVPFAADVACLAPRYLNIVRGQFVCLAVAFAIAPWRIVATSNGFLLFLNGYSIFQGSVVAIMLADFFVVRRGRVRVGALFRRDAKGLYWYTGGFNLRAFAAFVAGFALPLPGFVGSFGHGVGEAASHMFALGWALSFSVGGLAFWVLCTVWRVREGSDADDVLGEGIVGVEPPAREDAEEKSAKVEDSAV